MYFLFCAQIRVKVTDEGGLSDTELLVLNVLRNMNAPQFIGSNAFYSDRILENQDIGESLVFVTATDADEEVMIFIDSNIHGTDSYLYDPTVELFYNFCINLNHHYI